MAAVEQAPKRDVIVIGASAGGVEALQTLVSGLPADLDAAIFVVLHVAPSTTSVLPRILTRAGKLPAVHPKDGTLIRAGTIFVAPPDHHMRLAQGRIVLEVGPKENRHRPAIDPLFRSAAREFGPRVIGVILTGSGSDGTAGLLEITRQGGLAVVQDPEDALCDGMPLSALEFVQAEQCLPVADMAAALVALARDCPAPEAEVPRNGGRAMTSPKDSLDPSEERNLQQSAEAVEAGPHSGFTCPHCHGHLWEIQDGGHLRFRCRVGHALSADSLLEAKDEALESTLWAALNQFQENAALTRRLADRARARGHKLTAERMELRGTEAELHAKTLRTLLEGLLSPEFQLPSPDSRENDTVEEMLAGRDGYAD